MSPVSELRSRIAEMASGIADLECQLAQLRERKRRLDGELQAIIHPILTIPVEITAEILLHAAADSSIKRILALTSVCALWRSVALSTPRLWNASYHAARSRHRDPVNLLQLWLSRSGNLPLSISVDVFDDRERMLALLTSHIARWHQVDLCGMRSCGCEALENLKEVLPSLVLHGDVAFDLEVASCPKWRTFILCTPVVPLSALLPTLSNVTSLKLFEVASAVVSTVLRHTPAVEFLSVSGTWHGDLIEAHSNPPVVLPLVHTLEHCTPGWLNHLSLPALQNLIIPSHGFLPEDLEPFLTRSGCTLHMVHLQCYLPDGIENFLLAVPSVLEFIAEIADPDHVEPEVDEGDIDYSWITVRDFLDAFAAGKILPGVEKMTLSCVPIDLHKELYSAVHRKIQLPTSRLKKLTLEICWEEDVPESLRLALAERGVELEVRYIHRYL